MQRNRVLVAQRRAAEAEKRSSDYTAALTAQTFADILGNSASSGAAVTSHSALGVAAVDACVGLLSDMVGVLPLQLLRGTDRGDEVVRNHPAARVVQRPGDLHTSFEWRQLTMTGVGLGGNGYGRVHRARNGDPAEIEWIAPGDVSAERPVGERFIAYHLAGHRQVLTRYDMVHVRTKSRDGIRGISPITQLRESIGTSISQREASGRMMSNGAKFNGVIEAPLALRKDQVDDIKKQWAAKQEGVANAGKTPVLWGGQFKALSGMTAADAQFLESRRFELQEIARLYRIPAFLIGDTTANSSFSGGIEQQNLGFLAYSLNPWLVMWEQALDYTLLTTDELAAGLHFSFDREELGAVSLQAQSAFLTAMRTSGVFSPNDSREWLGYRRVDAEGMDDYQAPLNSSSSGSLGGDPTQKADGSQPDTQAAA